MSADHRRELVVDSDGGVDDAIALAWLLQRDDVEVVAWLAWRRAADFHEQDAHGDLHPIGWAVRGERERFRHHVRSWWS